MNFRKDIRDGMIMWDYGPARVYIWVIFGALDEEKNGKWRLTVHWGGSTSVATLDTQKEAEEKAKEILQENVVKFLERLEE